MVNSDISHIPRSSYVPKTNYYSLPTLMFFLQTDMQISLQNLTNIALFPRQNPIKPHNQNHTFPLHSLTTATAYLGGDLTRSIPATLASSCTKMTGGGVNPTAPTSNLVSKALQDHQTAEMAADPRLARIASSIRVIPDFPKKGIMFQDITTMLLDPVAFKETIDLFVERYKDKNISVVAGIEARGFIFGAPIALALGAKFVPMRKPKKLPGKVISEEYSLEYGTDIMEMHVGAVEAGENALIIDDLIATGGTLAAAIRLLERVGANIVECACLMELAELKGRERLGDKPLFVLISSA